MLTTHLLFTESFVVLSASLPALFVSTSRHVQARLSRRSGDVCFVCSGWQAWPGLAVVLVLSLLGPLPICAKHSPHTTVALTLVSSTMAMARSLPSTTGRPTRRPPPTVLAASASSACSAAWTATPAPSASSLPARRTRVGLVRVPRLSTSRTSTNECL